jgi:hypothetical protein
MGVRTVSTTVHRRNHKHQSFTKGWHDDLSLHQQAYLFSKGHNNTEVG